MMHASRCALLFAALAGAPALALQAQAAPNRAAAVEYRQQFLIDLDTLHAKVIALAKAVPADKYTWRPMPGTRTFGEVFMHIASEYLLYNPASFGGARSPLVKPGQAGIQAFEQNSSKDSVLKYLAAGIAYSHSALMAIPPDSLVGKRKMFGRELNIFETGIGMTADLHEHLGQLIAYARMNAIVPPWSK
ncbi:MAG TPA: DinB family protein [Gemmatimonadales bacterium]|nr:DinB family protein [Gemmatimonadales bacterium]